MILNIGNKPTFRNKLRSEVLDITLCSQDFPLSLIDWEVSDLIMTSDHEGITFKLCLDSLPPVLFRNPAATNWSLYSHLTDKFNFKTNHASPTSEEEIDLLAEQLQKFLVEAYETASPVHKHKAGNSVPY